MQLVHVPASRPRPLPVPVYYRQTGPFLAHSWVHPLPHLPLIFTNALGYQDIKIEGEDE